MPSGFFSEGEFSKKKLAILVELESRPTLQTVEDLILVSQDPSHRLSLNNQDFLEKQMQEEIDIGNKKSCLFALLCCRLLLDIYAKKQQDAEMSVKRDKCNRAIEDLKRHYQGLCGREGQEEKQAPSEGFSLNQAAEANAATLTTYLQAMCAALQAFWLSVLNHLSNLITAITIFNLYRIYWIFCRLSVIAWFKMAAEASLLQTISEWLHRSIGQIGLWAEHRRVELESITAALNWANFIMNFLSIAIFAVRMSMYIMTIAHEVSKAAPGTKLDVFFKTLVKEQWHLYNDLLWPIVNLLTNYELILVTTAMQLTALALAFDTISIMIQLALKCREYAKGNKALREEITELAFYMVGAAIVWGGFCAVFLWGAPAIFTATAIVGVSMYLTGGKFAKWRTAANDLANASPHNEAALKQTNSEARTAFLLAFIGHVFIPTIVVGLLAISWELTLGLAVMAAVIYGIHQLISPKQNKADIAKEERPKPRAEEKPAATGESAAKKSPWNNVNVPEFKRSTSIASSRCSTWSRRGRGESDRESTASGYTLLSASAG